MSVPTGIGNYPAGVTDNDPHFEPDHEDDPDPEDGLVIDCGLEGCLMPGYHFREECHTAEMLEAYYAECEREDNPTSLHPKDA